MTKWLVKGSRSGGATNSRIVIWNFIDVHFRQENIKVHILPLQAVLSGSLWRVPPLSAVPNGFPVCSSALKLGLCREGIALVVLL